MSALEAIVPDLARGTCGNGDLLRSLFPAGCTVAFRTEPGNTADLCESEAACIEGARAERRTEFATGRACVRQAFRAAGLPPYAIPSDNRRAPVWPHGVAGSISHCPGLCVAVIAPRLASRAVGVDVETVAPLGEILREVVALPAERPGLARLRGRISADPYKLLFVIKEALFKFYFPTTRHFLDFRHARVCIDPADRAFEAEIVDPAAPPLAGLRRFSGRFALTDRHIMAGLAL